MFFFSLCFLYVSDFVVVVACLSLWVGDCSMANVASHI